MGYATPANNINQSLGVINDQISNNQTKMDQTFADMRNMYADQIAQQQAFEAAEEEKRALGNAKWDEKVSAAEAKLPGGFDEMVRKRVNDWGDEYYATIGDNSPEAVRRRRELESYPMQAANGFASYRAGKEKYSQGIGIQKGQPGSINTYEMSTTDRALYSEGVNYNGQGLTLNDVDGKLVWGCKSSVDGKDYSVSNQEFINRALSGNTGVKTVGDAQAYMKELGGGVKKEMEYDQKIKVTDKTDPNQHTVQLGRANDQLQTAMSNPNLYNEALGNQEMMRGMFPGLVNKVQAAAKDPNHPQHDQALTALAGPDGILEDDPDTDIDESADNFGSDDYMRYEGVEEGDRNTKMDVDENVKIGQWVSDPEWPNRQTQDAVAVLGFQLSTPDNFYMKPKTTETTLYGKDNPHGRKRNYGNYNKGDDEEKKKVNKQFQNDMKKLDNMYTTEGVLTEDLTSEQAMERANEIFNDGFTNVKVGNTTIASWEVEDNNGNLLVVPMNSKGEPIGSDGGFRLNNEGDRRKLEKFLGSNIGLLEGTYNVKGEQRGGSSNKKKPNPKNEENKTWVEMQLEKKNNNSTEPVAEPEPEIIAEPEPEVVGPKGVMELESEIDEGGKETGQETYTYSNGDKYVGEWKNDKRNGQGTYTHNDGRKYVGEFKDGEMHGKGTYTSADGQTWTVYHENGEWRDDDSGFAYSIDGHVP